MSNPFKTEEDRQRFEQLWTLSEQQISQGLVIEGVETELLASSLAHYVAVVGKARSAEWSPYSARFEALAAEIDAALGTAATVSDGGSRIGSLELVGAQFFAEASDQESILWEDLQSPVSKPWPPLAQVSRHLPFGDVTFDISIAGTSIAGVLEQVPSIGSLLADTDEYWVEIVTRLNSTGSPLGRMSGYSHGSRIRRGPLGWVPKNLSTRMKLSSVQPWMEGPNRELLDDFYEIRQEGGSVIFEARDEERVPGPADWLTLDRYNNAPPEVQHQYLLESFVWPSPGNVMSVPQGRPEENLPPKIVKLPLAFEVEYRPDVTETFVVSVFCDGPSLHVQDKIESWWNYVMSTDPPGMAFIGDGKWIDTANDGVWIWQFTCDLGGTGSVEWLERLFEQLKEHVVKRVVVSGGPVS